jgi:Icc-related predicted phosphoesterase
MPHEGILMGGKNHKIVFTADLHGNEEQYRQLVGYAIANKADSVIIGGDLCPKQFPAEYYIQTQRKFLEDRLAMLLEPLKNKSPGTALYLITGNDDCTANLDLLLKHDGSLFHLINSKRMRLTTDLDIVGYPYISISPFRIKDWEKYDFSKASDGYRSQYTKRKNTGYRLDGWKSTDDGWQDFIFKEEMAWSDSIQKDLLKPEFRQTPGKTVYVIHDPPAMTNLDLVPKGHVGSLAVREFIEKLQPYLTLHGHIHETVELSGSFKDTIGNTLCMAAGNLERGGLSLIVFDLYEPENAERVVIPSYSS